MKYRKFAVVLVVVLAGFAAGAGSPQPSAEDDPWRMSYEEAQKQAKESNKPVMACFLGSDWCPFCVHLLKEVLNTSDFKKWAEQNVVLLIVDSPKNTPQDLEVKKQNKELKERFKVKGVPVTVLISPDGKVIGRISKYTEKEKWQKQLQGLMQKAQTKSATKES